MILTVFLNFIDNFLLTIIGFLPVGNLPVGITNGISYFWGVLNSFSYILPVSTMLSASVVVISFDAAVLLWHMVQWIIRKIPGMS